MSTTDADTGAEAWPEDAVHADDVVTETEAGPLEESDIDAEGADEHDHEPDDDVVTETEAGPLEESDADATVDAIDDSATDETDTDETDGDSAEEKGK